MRVIAGTVRGTILKAGRGLGIRPTSDRVKEAIFNILGERVLNAVFLDLFAGTGALAIEALSREAARATLVEFSRSGIEIIKHNLNATSLAERAEIAAVDVFGYIKKAANRGEKFDIIAADPPYDRNIREEVEEISLAKRTLLAISENDIMRNGSILFIEHSVFEELMHKGALEALSTRKYGSTAVSFFRKK